MAYIVHTYLRPTLTIRKALTQLFGIGTFRAHQICDQLGFPLKKRVEQLTPSHINILTRILTHSYFTESELQRAVSEDIKRLIFIGCYRGFRHVLRLPLRGQRTRTNARTCRLQKKKVS